MGQNWDRAFLPLVYKSRAYRYLQRTWFYFHILRFQNHEFTKHSWILLSQHFLDHKGSSGETKRLRTFSVRFLFVNSTFSLGWALDPEVFHLLAFFLQVYTSPLHSTRFTANNDCKAQIILNRLRKNCHISTGIPLLTTNQIKYSLFTKSLLCIIWALQ